jgi:hypothetical protein
MSMSLPSGVRGHSFRGPVPGQFDTVALGILEVDRFAAAMVARSGDRHAMRDDAPVGCRQRRTIRIEDRNVMEPGRARRRFRAAAALPGIQRDVVVIAASTENRSLVIEAPRVVSPCRRAPSAPGSLRSRSAWD